MQKWLLEAFKKLTTTKVQTSMKIIYWYGSGLVVLTILLIASWIIDWHCTGRPNIPLLKDIFKEYTATTVVAAVTFISVFCVNKNHDGRPDAAERLAKGDKR